MKDNLRKTMQRAVVKIAANRFVATLTNYRINRVHFAPDMLLAKTALRAELSGMDKRLAYYIGLHIADQLQRMERLRAHAMISNIKWTTHQL